MPRVKGLFLSNDEFKALKNLASERFIELDMMLRHIAVLYLEACDAMPRQDWPERMVILRKNDKGQYVCRAESDPAPKRHAPLEVSTGELVPCGECGQLYHDTNRWRPGRGFCPTCQHWHEQQARESEAAQSTPGQREEAA